MARDYIKFRLTWFEGMVTLSPAEKGRLLEAIWEHIELREVRNLPGRENLLFNMIRAELDKDEAKHLRRCQTNKENINKRWGIQNDTKNTNRTNLYASTCARDDDHDDPYSLNDRSISGNQDNEENEGWYSFVKEYEQNIAPMPTSPIAVQELQGYHEALGAEVIHEAVRAVALAYPANPQTYFRKVCREWIANDVKTKEDASAQLDRWRKRNKREKEVKPIDGNEFIGLTTAL